MELSIVLLLYLSIIVLDFIPLIKKGGRGKIWLYLAMLIFTFSILVLNIFGVAIPSPAVLIKGIINSFM